MKAEGWSASHILSTLGLGVRDLRVIGSGAAEAMRVCGCTTVSALTTAGFSKADAIAVGATSEDEYCDVWT